MNPRSPQARAIMELFGETLVVCGVIFVLVCGLIVYVAWKFRESKDRAPSTLEGHKRLEIGWTIAPIVIVTGLFALTMRAMAASDPPLDREPDVTVIAHQWWWEARYKSGAVTANEIHIPTGKALVVAVESADVVHDFWVPELGRKIDAIPGRHASIWIQADEPGLYTGACAEYCGAQHAWMRILVVAEPPAAFAAWEQHETQRAKAPATDAEARGGQLFRKLTCIKCHDIAGNGEGARAAPDLTHLGERKTIGAGVIANTPAELGRWLKHPQDVKKGSHMPDLLLTDAQVDDFVAYFESLK